MINHATLVERHTHLS